MKSTKQLFAGTAIIRNTPASEYASYDQLEDLMKVIDELCPEWPQRRTFRDSDIFLL